MPVAGSGCVDYTPDYQRSRQSSASRLERRVCGQDKAFTGLRPARPFSRRKRTQNALRRARAVSAASQQRPLRGLRLRCARSASCLTGSLRFSSNAGRHQLGHPCLRSLRDPARCARYAFTAPLRGLLGQTVVPCSRIRLRCSARFTARCRTRPAHPCATARLPRFIPPHHGNVGSAPDGA